MEKKSVPKRKTEADENQKKETIDAWLNKMPPTLADNEIPSALPNIDMSISTIPEREPSGESQKKIKEERRRKRKEKRDRGKIERAKEKDHAVKFLHKDEPGGKVEPKPVRVDRGELHRRVTVHHRTLKPEFLKMPPKMQAYIAESQSIQSETSSHLHHESQTSWKPDWDVLVSDIHAHLPKKEKHEKEPEPSVQSVKIPDSEAPVIIKRHIITKDNIDDTIFGYRSLLSDQTRFIFREYSTYSSNHDEAEELTEPNDPDMTWLRNLSPSEAESNRKIFPEWRKEHKLITNPMHLFWFYLALGGLMPFNFERDKNPAKVAVLCKFDRRRRRYYTFLLTSIILLLVTIISFTSFTRIFFASENVNDPLTQIEKLLLDKNWVTGLVFMTSLFMATVSSFSILVNGGSMAKYITDWEESLGELNFNATPGIRLITIVFIMWTITQVVVEAILFYSKRLELNPFIEGIHLITVLLFRNYKQDVLLSIHRDYFAAFALSLNAYALYCARSFILFVMVYSVGITNLANEWNLRLRLVLRQVTTLENESNLQNLVINLNYQKLFDEHKRIVKLLKETSAVFGLILVTFYITQGVACSGELVETAIYLVSLKQLQTPAFNQTQADRVNYTYERDFYNRVDLGFHISQTGTTIILASVYISATGNAIMNALDHITHHNFMNTILTRQRRFVMSLMMSFNPKKPYLLGAGNLFGIDRSFMFTILAGAMYFLSVMVQTRIPRLLSVPILFECEPGSGTLCIRHMVVPPSGLMYINLDILPTTTTSMSTTPTTTTTMSTTPTTTTTMSTTPTTTTTMSTTPTTTTTTTTTMSTTPTTMSTTSTTLSTTPTTMRTTITTTRTIPPRREFPCKLAGGAAVGSQTRYCNGTHVARYHVYNSDATLKTDLGKTLDCMFFPYPASKGPYFDCFGNQLSNVTDSCGMLNFGFGVGNMPRPVSVNIYAGHFAKEKAVSCYTLNTGLYSDINDKWYPCGVPRWLARTVCDKGTITDVNVLKTMMMDDISRNLLAKPAVKNIRDIRCVKSPGQLLELSFEDSLETRQVLDEVPSPSPRRYFPFFHPLLLDDATLDKINVYGCERPTPGGRPGRPPPRRRLMGVFYRHDECGGLDFGTGTVIRAGPKTGKMYQCFDTCTGDQCEKWEEWYDNNKPTP